MDKISERAGYVRCAGGGWAPVYCSRRPHLCLRCGAVIGEGEYFTRWPLVKGGPPVSSRCRKCAPFDLRMAEKEREPALIDALLRPGPGDSSAKGWPASARQDVQERERLRQAARDRLAPALAYIRRRRTTGDR